MVGVRESVQKTGEIKLGWSRTKLEEAGKTKLGEGKTKLEVETENPKFAKKG